ncbi:hypothetical protein AOQ71_04545 [Bradyrhizobium manausense]|uniref:Uncharacterized protein n=1 Tax=Bradyrhizobium manausense TaxID=989370 RepID=A0A0R3EB44_9BRAD|nr:hypothetical protein AOQ71_04545 [Bradyrhizobium manausense]
MAHVERGCHDNRRDLVFLNKENRVRGTHGFVASWADRKIEGTALHGLRQLRILTRIDYQNDVGAIFFTAGTA